MAFDQSFNWPVFCVGNRRQSIREQKLGDSYYSFPCFNKFFCKDLCKCAQIQNPYGTFRICTDQRIQKSCSARCPIVVAWKIFWEDENEILIVGDETCWSTTNTSSGRRPSANFSHSIFFNSLTYRSSTSRSIRSLFTTSSQKIFHGCRERERKITPEHGDPFHLEAGLGHSLAGLFGRFWYLGVTFWCYETKMNVLARGLKGALERFGLTNRVAYFPFSEVLETIQNPYLSH